MPNYRFLLDNDVSHLANSFPTNQVAHLSEYELVPNADDKFIVQVASENGLIIVTHNRKDFEKYVPQWIARSSKKQLGCTQVHGLIVLLPSTKYQQEQAIKRAASQLEFEGRPVTWKDVNKLCLKVVIEISGKARITKLPRCPHCKFADEE